MHVKKYIFTSNGEICESEYLFFIPTSQATLLQATPTQGGGGS